MAVCTGKISCEAYNEAVQGALQMIRTGKKDILRQLRERCSPLRKRLDFENAALLRDQIAAIERVAAGQKVVREGGERWISSRWPEQAGRSAPRCCATGRGALTDKREFVFHDTADITAVREEFLPRYYLDGEEIPKTIAVDALPDDHEALRQALEEARGSKIEFYVPQRGDMGQACHPWNTRSSVAAWPGKRPLYPGRKAA